MFKLRCIRHLYEWNLWLKIGKTYDCIGVTTSHSSKDVAIVWDPVDEQWKRAEINCFDPITE